MSTSDWPVEWGCRIGYQNAAAWEVRLGQAWRRTLGEYRGRLMRCAPGTHEAAAAMIGRHVRPDGQGEQKRDVHVLDLASGTGAFLTRLRDAGFVHLHAVELNVAGFDVPGVTPQPVDLNSAFAGALPHDMGLVSAIEIIEHLDCPRHFLRNIRELLSPGGYLLLTTPNFANWLGRVRFLISGELRQFQRRDYDYQRHISPVTDIQMRLIFEELGFELIESTTAGSFDGPVKQAVYWPITTLARAMLGRLANGEVSLYLVRKAASTTDSSGRDSFYFRTTGA